MEFFQFIAAGIAAWADGRYAEAEHHLRASLKANPLYTATWRMLAATLVGLGRIAEAREIAKHHAELEPSFYDKPAPYTWYVEPLNSRLVEQWRKARILAPKRDRGVAARR